MAFLALSSAIAAAAWQHYGDDAKQMMADWTPSFVLSSSPQADKPAVAGQPGRICRSGILASHRGQPVSTQPASPAQATEAATSAAAAKRRRPCSRWRAMSRDGSTDRAAQSQHRTAQGRPGANLCAARPRSCEMPTEQSPRPRVSALPPRPTAPPVRKPRPAFSPPQAAAALPPALPHRRQPPQFPRRCSLNHPREQRLRRTANR